MHWNTEFNSYYQPISLYSKCYWKHTLILVLFLITFMWCYAVVECSVSPRQTESSLGDLILRKHCRKRGGNIVEQKDQGVGFEIVSASNIRSYTYKVSATWPPKSEQNKDNGNGHTKVDSREPMRHEPCTMNYRHQRKAGRNSIRMYVLAVHTRCQAKVFGHGNYIN